MHTAYRALTLAALFAALASQADAQYTATSLHPAGLFGSTITGVGGTTQTGQVSQYDGLNPYQYGAGMWSGTAGSFVMLHPAAFQSSYATSADGTYQYGWVYDAANEITTAARWQGSAGSYVSYHPGGYVESQVLGAAGGQQIGVGTVLASDGFGTYSAPRALLWSGGAPIDLTPGGVWGAYGNSLAAGVQVGHLVLTRGGDITAALWNGSAASYQNIHPVGYTRSSALSTDGTQAVGYGVTPTNNFNAILWQGNPSVGTSLNPALATDSNALAVRGGVQVGWVMVGGQQKAALWKGTAASYVDLHQYLPAGFSQSTANAIDANGRIYGTAMTIGSTPNGNFSTTYAVMWTPDAPQQPTYTLTSFAQPINDPVGTESVFKYGRTVPVKIKLLDSAGKPVANATLTISVIKLGTVESAVNESSITTPADNGTTFRYDAAAGQYIYNLGTGGLQAGARYRVTAAVAGTGLTHSVTIGIH